MPRHLLGFMIQYRYELIFPFAVVEGPVITMVSGFLVSLGYLSLIPTFAIVLMGDMISDSGFYTIGRYAAGLLKKVKFFRVSEKRLEKLESHYEKHPAKTLAVGKISYGLGSFFLAAAGASKMEYPKFLQYIFVPNAVRSGILLGIGYYFGAAYRQFGTYIHYYVIGVFITVSLGLFVSWWMRRQKLSELGKAMIEDVV